MGANGLDVFDRTHKPPTSDSTSRCRTRPAVTTRGSRQRRLPVVNRDKRLVGISALGDLAVGQSPPLSCRAANARNARRT